MRSLGPILLSVANIQLSGYLTTQTTCECKRYILSRRCRPCISKDWNRFAAVMFPDKPVSWLLLKQIIHLLTAESLKIRSKVWFKRETKSFKEINSARTKKVLFKFKIFVAKQKQTKKHLKKRNFFPVFSM